MRIDHSSLSLSHERANVTFNFNPSTSIYSCGGGGKFLFVPDGSTNIYTVDKIVPHTSCACVCIFFGNIHKRHVKRQLLFLFVCSFDSPVHSNSRCVTSRVLFYFIFFRVCWKTYISYMSCGKKISLDMSCAKYLRRKEKKHFFFQQFVGKWKLIFV